MTRPPLKYLARAAGKDGWPGAGLDQTAGAPSGSVTDSNARSAGFLFLCARIELYQQSLGCGLSGRRNELLDDCVAPFDQELGATPSLRPDDLIVSGDSTGLVDLLERGLQVPEDVEEGILALLPAGLDECVA